MRVGAGCDVPMSALGQADGRAAIPTRNTGSLEHVVLAPAKGPEEDMSDTDRVWELMKKISICMLASWDGEELQAIRLLSRMRAYTRK